MSQSLVSCSTFFIFERFYYLGGWLLLYTKVSLTVCRMSLLARSWWNIVLLLIHLHEHSSLVGRFCLSSVAFGSPSFIPFHPSGPFSASIIVRIRTIFEPFWESFKTVGLRCPSSALVGFMESAVVSGGFFVELSKSRCILCFNGIGYTFIPTRFRQSRRSSMCLSVVVAIRWLVYPLHIMGMHDLPVIGATSIYRLSRTFPHSNYLALECLGVHFRSVWVCASLLLPIFRSGCGLTSTSLLPVWGQLRIWSIYQFVTQVVCVCRRGLRHLLFSTVYVDCGWDWGVMTMKILAISCF
jgi:hypothetical protein